MNQIPKPTRVRVMSLALLLFGCLICLGVPSQAQEQPGRKWLTLETKLELTAIAGSLAADGWTTRRVLGHNIRELNPISRPFMQTNKGAAAYSSLSLAGAAGGSWALRRHPWLRRSLSWGLVGLEVGCAVHNSRLRLAR